MGCHVTSHPLEDYRPCVGIFLLDGRGQVFVGRRIDVRGQAWQMPQGGIDAHERPLDAGLREMREEIGTDKASLLAESRYWRSYDLARDIAGRLWKGRYKGQSQKWLAFRFEGADSDIVIDGEHAEFDSWRWADPEALSELIVPFKRDVYLSVVDEFRPLWA